MIDPEKMRLFMQALKPDLPGLARQVFIENPQTAMRELPGKLQASRDLLNQYEPGKGIDPRLMDQFMNLTGSFAPMGLTAWHGSPRALTAFDIEKAGTGAGTMNFGYGTYFAEHPEIAGLFRKGRTPSPDNPEGNLYKVDIPDADIPKMLNWYEEVPEKLRQNLSKKAMDQFGSGLSPSTGERLYKEVVFSFKNSGSKTPEKDASNWLAEQGVPGIKYENMQMVRGMGRDTNNYVVFKPEAVKIEKVYSDPMEELRRKGLLD